MNIYYRVKREVIKYKKGMTQKSRFLKKQDFVESAPGKSSLFSPRGIQFTSGVVINLIIKKPIELALQLAFVVKFDRHLSFTCLHSSTFLLLLSIF